MKQDSFSFSAAHFLIFPGNKRESLHGHNFRLSLKIQAQTLQDGMLIDFTELSPIIQHLCKSLDHKILIPENNRLRIKKNSSNYEILTSDQSFFSLPISDTIILPIPNTTAEYLAEFMAHELIKKISAPFASLEVEIEEDIGKSGSYLINRSSDK